MPKMKLMTGLAAATLFALTACGGGGDDTGGDIIPGDDVAAKAEVALASEVDNLDEGNFECPDVERKVGATATCTRSSAAQEYYGAYEGTIDITELQDGGDDFGLHVQMADEPTEFGITGESIEQDLSNQAKTQFGAEPSAIDCPDLEGEDGNEVTCTMTVDGEEMKVVVTATEVDLSAPSMSYTFAGVNEND